MHCPELPPWKDLLPNRVRSATLQPSPPPGLPRLQRMTFPKSPASQGSPQIHFNINEEVQIIISRLKIGVIFILFKIYIYSGNFPQFLGFDLDSLFGSVYIM